MVMVIGIMFPLARREIFAIDRFVFCLIFSTTTLVVIILFCGIHPNVELFVPTNGKEEWSLHFLDRSFVSFRVVGVVDADQRSDLSINLRLAFRAGQLLKLLAIREVPNLHRSVS